MRGDLRWAWAEIDLDAVRHNIRTIRERVAPSAVWAVVKANGYGHGSVDVARAAIEAGAEGLCVALVQEGIDLRRAGVDAPILLLSEQPPELASAIIEYRLTPSVYRREFLEALAREAPSGLPVHLLVDTGMQRVGTHPHAAASMAAAIAQRAPAVRLAGVFTHLAVADDPSPASVEFTDRQLSKFAKVLEQLPPVPLVHIANSAGALAHPAARQSMVRVGIAMYGIAPSDALDDLCSDLRPAMELRSRVSFVKQVRSGSAISYGLKHTFSRDTTVATVPLGYADGVPRRLSEVGGEVLIAGRRCPIVGVVTMDQLMVDCGDHDVRVGDDVTLIGEQGGETIRAEDWARRLGTIGYEIVCGISERIPRVPRRSIDN
ncbi:alanine racemase [Ilumatobacter coccineus]|jgi:alanine racemase|uniref:Alanine racemase n=1 Tax=Ilumatobacter coccineus (strain NBRC 103263 / KCTC 29153 / YM16-304) TaxID=1313172 RepID=A0A6C7EB14_ILUCY|nr:alanine racemase [Ilumatobacter coccineus]BAN01206.1 alanine racemase [Ilumatobacter coccineus YM16-304]